MHVWVREGVAVTLSRAILGIRNTWREKKNREMGRESVMDCFFFFLLMFFSHLLWLLLDKPCWKPAFYLQGMLAPTHKHNYMYTHAQWEWKTSTQLNQQILWHIKTHVYTALTHLHCLLEDVANVEKRQMLHLYSRHSTHTDTHTTLSASCTKWQLGYMWVVRRRQGWDRDENMEYTGWERSWPL